MERKALRGVEIKDADQGVVEAVFSTFNVVDKDGDVTLPGAFEDGASVRVSAYGHRSWTGELPVGKGRIRTTKEDARVEAKFFMDTTHGRDTFSVVKGMGDLQEWSYGFDVLEEAKPDEDEFPGARRVLKKLKAHEVSPVLMGAGVDTRTLAVKGIDGEELSLRFELVEVKEDEDPEEEKQEEKEPDDEEVEASDGEEKKAADPEEEGPTEEELKAREEEIARDLARISRNLEKSI